MSNIATSEDIYTDITPLTMKTFQLSRALTGANAATAERTRTL